MSPTKLIKRTSPQCVHAISLSIAKAQEQSLLIIEHD